MDVDAFTLRAIVLQRDASAERLPHVSLSHRRAVAEAEPDNIATADVESHYYTKWMSYALLIK